MLSDDHINKFLAIYKKRFGKEIIREEAIRAGSPYVDYRWLGGMLTNFKTVQLSIKRLRELATEDKTTS